MNHVGPHYLVSHCSIRPMYTRSVTKTVEGYQAVGRGPLWVQSLELKPWVRGPSFGTGGMSAQRQRQRQRLSARKDHTILYSTILYSTLLYSTLPYSTLLYSTLLYSALLYSTLLYYTLLYYTMLYFVFCQACVFRK